MSTSAFEGYYVVAKWFGSKAPSGGTNLISRSLGKFSIIDNGYQGPEVKDQDVYLCRITKEIKPGTNTGAFVLMPVQKLDADQDLRKLIPGFYDMEIIGKGNARAAVIRPNSDPDQYWMLSKNTRQIFSNKYYAVIVPIDYKGDNNVG